MTEVGGDLADVCTSFEEMGCKAMTQGVDDEFGVFFVEAAFDFSDLDGGPGAAVGHGFSAVVKGLFERSARALPSTTGSGKEPVGITMPGPELAEPSEEFR